MVCRTRALITHKLSCVVVCQVRKAVLALQKYQSTRARKKQRLIEENPLVSLIIGLKKTPNKTFKPHRM